MILLAIFVPIFSPFDVSNAGDSAVKNLEPKLFNSGGFWDGTITVTQREVDPVTHLPDPELYYLNGVSDVRDFSEGFTSRKSRYATGGYIQTGFYGGEGNEVAYLESTSSSLAGQEDLEYEFTLDVSKSTLMLTSFVVADETMIDKELGETLPENFTLGLTSLEFVYSKNSVPQYVEIVSPSITHKIGLTGGTSAINVSDIIYEKTGQKIFTSFYFRF